MRQKSYCLLALLILLLTVPAGAQPLLGDCVIGPGLAATLLFPYFEVDLADPAGRTTLLSINNGVSGPVLARVVLWTDWGVPTLAFDVYLPGFDVQTISVRQLFEGTIPSTGEDADLSAFELCDMFPPDHLNPVLSVDQRDQMIADHTGQEGPIFGDCAGEPHADQIVRGYITADVVDECSGVEGDGPGDGPFFTPANADWPYFAEGGDSSGIATLDNYLWGDVIYVDPANNAAQGSDAIAIWADAGLFTDADIFTFYGRYSGWDGRDERVPLPWLWNQRFLNGGSFAGGADLLVFRDTGTPVELATCGNRPSWWPLADSSSSRDEDAANFFFIGTTTFPVATERVSVSSFGIPYPFGRIQSSFGASGMPMGAWVQPTLTGLGLYSAAFHGAPALSLCDETPPVAVASPPGKTGKTGKTGTERRRGRRTTHQR